jgi:hypothetical protein
MRFNSVNLDFTRKDCGELSDNLYIFLGNVTDKMINDGILGIEFIGNCDKTPMRGYMEFYFTANRR